MNSRIAEKFSGSRHTQSECKTLMRHGEINAIDFLKCPEIVMPLRCLLLREYDRNNWDRFLEMEAHMEQRRDTGIWKLHKKVENVRNENTLYLEL